MTEPTIPHDKREPLEVNPNSIPIWSITLAFDEAVAKGLITTEVRQTIEDRADEFAVALYEGKALFPDTDGTVTIGEIPAPVGTLVLGGQ